MTVGETVLFGPTGGEVWDDGDYRYHRLEDGETFEVPFDITVDRLIAASGAGGGGPPAGGAAGGGAAGRVHIESDVLMTAGSYPVEIDPPGQGGFDGENGEPGGDTRFDGVTALGGGYGSEGSVQPGGDGGSGGGAGGRDSNPGGSADDSEGGIGHDGGRSQVATTVGTAAGGGGGGGDAAGGDSPGTQLGGDGADGVEWPTGSGDYFGAGGGGSVVVSSSHPTGTPGQGGLGGGGDGGITDDPETGPGGHAESHKGSGGGGGGSTSNENTQPGGDGSSGTVRVRYLLSDLAEALSIGADSHVHGQVLDVTDVTGWTINADARVHRLSQMMQVTLPEPETETWRVELLDRNTWQPSEGVGPDMAPVLESMPTLELSSGTSWEFTTTGPMGKILLDADRPPDFVARLWRGFEIVEQGPILTAAADPQDGRVRINVQSMWHHPARSTVGPAETPNELINPYFSGGLSGWIVVQTDTLNDYPLLVPTTPGAASVVGPSGSVPGTPTGKGRWARLRGDLTDPQPLSISQVQRGIVTPTNRDVQIRAFAVFYLPNGADERTNQNIAVGLGAYPSGYSFPQDSFVAAADAHRAGTQRILEWPEPAAQGRLIAMSEEVTLRAGSGVKDVVVTFGAPFADCYLTNTFMTVSDSLVASGTVTDVIRTLIEHGEDDSILGHAEHGLSVIGIEQGDLPYLDEEWGWWNHTRIGSAIDALVSGGLGEWRMHHHMTGSTIEVLSRDTDGNLAEVGGDLTITTTDVHQPSWLESAAVTRDWSSGSTTVVAQSAGIQAFHERGAVDDDPIGWTEVVPMPDHVPPWRADMWAQRMLELAGKRGQVLIAYGEDAPRRLHRARPGSRCELNIDVEGVHIQSRMLIRSHRLNASSGGILSLTEVV